MPPWLIQPTFSLPTIEGQPLARTSRLFDLLQILRGSRRPVTGTVLASRLDVSLRTVYRDVATLIAQGAPIAGEAGLGYVLEDGFFLPPLMFSADETDALILGLRLASGRGDETLQAAAAAALAKIAAVLPRDRDGLEPQSGLLVYGAPEATPHLGVLREALRLERKLRLHYRDAKDRATERIVWPVAVGFFDGLAMLAAWCEIRDDFRHFRLDRIVAAEQTGAAMPRRRRVLLAEWRIAEELDQFD